MQNNTRYIFCISSGRSGTGYLAKLTGTAENVRAFHEADPTMSGSYLRMIDHFAYSETADQRTIKVKKINQIIESFKRKPWFLSKSNMIYVETNHMFIKTFHDVVCKYFKNVEVIILRRRIAETLKSFIQLNYFTPYNPVSFEWMSSPNAITAAIPAIDQDDKLDSCDKAIAYLIDIEARSQRFKREFPDIPTYELKLEMLSEKSYIQNFFKVAQLNYTEKTDSFIGERINERKRKKEIHGIHVDLTYCQERIEIYLRKAQKKGIQIPTTLYI
ncbi:MAG: hypothetical protein HF978_14540 [Desulfobacteraceae bacterium]|nr:hypothetical protein [Desulfobacteraceae bacterium]MBC2756758.1 hypothetical protein [Desulfobacteraceae bacterium]